MFLINFPLMLVPFAVYNFFIVGGDLNPWENIVLRVDMMSGANFTLSMGEGLIVIALLLLFVEILKATRVGFLDDHRSYPVHHRPHRLSRRVPDRSRRPRPRPSSS